MFKSDTLAIAYPSGNTTALILNPSTKILNYNRKDLQREIIKKFPKVEQSGFVFEERLKLEMFGGEFCGNATRSAVKVLFGNKKIKSKITVSGVSQALTFINLPKTVRLEMPVYKDSITKNQLGFRVDLEGISHIVITDKKVLLKIPLETQNFKIWAKKILKRFQMLDLPASGVTCLFEDRTTRFAVWIKEIETIFEETACGSGTCSCGIVLANQNKLQSEWLIQQPSSKKIRVGKNNTNWWIEGSVKILKILPIWF